MNTKSKTRRLALLTMLLAMGILLHMFEPSLPIPIPGVKLGLANIIGLITFFMFSYKEMFSVNLMRVLIASLLRGIIFGTGFWLSLAGVLLSSLMVVILRKTTKLSIVGLSVASAVFHCLGQIIVICFLNSTWLMVYWLPIMWVSAVPTGIITGTLAKQVLRRIMKGGFSE
jgi:heptaprenyl diphosphate synthase